MTGSFGQNKNEQLQMNERGLILKVMFLRAKYERGV